MSMACQHLTSPKSLSCTSKFLLINARAVTLGKGQRKVIQYIFPDLYFLCPKYLRFSSNRFDVRSKSHCGGGGGGGGGGNDLKTYLVTPDWGDLIKTVVFVSEHINITGLKFMGTSCEIILRWMPQNTNHDKSTLVQVIAWCCQATSHYLAEPVLTQIYVAISWL